MNPQQNGQSPLDYLNQIAPAAPQRRMMNSKPMLFIMIGVIAVVVVIIISLVVSAIAASKKDPWAQLVVKLNATEVIVNNSSTKLKSSQLRSINSSLRLSITNTKRDLSPHVLAAGVDVKKLPPKIVNTEAKNGMTERLETGRLNAKYDSTYAREMSYQTASLLAILQQLYAQSNSQSAKTFLKTTYDNLAPTQKALAEFSALNE